MTEHDGAGFPLSYCLLNSASSISPGKQKKTLTAWENMLQDMYRIYPVFIHFNKDMAEISMAWESYSLAKKKNQCCFWHMEDAINAQMKKGTLATVPYKPTAANKEFPFISKTFCPLGRRVNVKDYEGGEDSHQRAKTVDDRPWALQFTLPTPSDDNEEDMQEEEEEEGVEMQDDGPQNKFCPVALHSQVCSMFSDHFHAHPLILGMPT